MDDITGSTSGTPDDSTGAARTTGTATSDPLRDLLTRVAAGEVDPTEAARLLDEAGTPGLDRGTADTVVATGSPSVAAVTLLAGGVKLVVVADPTVATAVADGPHSVRHDGSTLVIEAPSGEGYQVQDKPRFLGWVPTVWTGGRGERVTVRVNPDLPLTVRATACSVDVSGVHADLTVTADASSVKVQEHRGALHGTARMSSVSIVGAITGASSYLCEFGSLNLRLTPGSDVVVAAMAEMGSLRVGDGQVTPEDGGMRSRATTGSGSHPFDLTVRMGSASVVAA
ncbi:MAG TPA: hypothetical protein VLV82_03365 [Candidatus Angelobacter sp.]|nr:hypothetical protein [Candidatus Angelobacter sp.]